MTREDKEYLNSKIAAYGKAHPNGNKEDLELLDEMRGHNLISKKEAMLMTSLAVKAKEKEMIDKACECFELAEDWSAWANGDFEYAKSYFRKVMEE